MMLIRVQPRLAIMMLAFYFSISAWLVTLSTYLLEPVQQGGLNYNAVDVGWLYSTFAFGGMIAPMITGLLADRFFRAERVLAVATIICAGLLFIAGNLCAETHHQLSDLLPSPLEGEGLGVREKATSITQNASELERLSPSPPTPLPQGRGEKAAPSPPTPLPQGRGEKANNIRNHTFNILFPVMLTYCVLMHLSMTLTTVIAFRTMPNAQRNFSRIRVWGTIGWIIAGNVLGFLLVPVSEQPLYLAAGSALFVGLYAFTLPATLPMGTGRTIAEIVGLPALKLLKNRTFAVFVLTLMATAILNQFYVVFGHRYLVDHQVVEPVQVMTFGQLVEVGVMFMLPVLDPKRRMKLLMAIGLAGYAVRGVAMWYGWVPGVILLGVSMHGWSYAFFGIVGTSYLDREAPVHLRASVQGIITFASGGVGVWLGNMFASRIVEANTTIEAIDWPTVWLFPLFGCSIVLLAFLVFFQPNDK